MQASLEAPPTEGKQPYWKKKSEGGFKSGGGFKKFGDRGPRFGGPKKSFGDRGPRFDGPKKFGDRKPFGEGFTGKQFGQEGGPRFGGPGRFGGPKKPFGGKPFGAKPFGTNRCPPPGDRTHQPVGNGWPSAKPAAD